MSDDFGNEFFNLMDLIRSDPMALALARDTTGPGLDVSSQFNYVIGLAGRLVQNGIILYLPPGRYRLPHNTAEPNPRTRYELPENVQLYLCQGALLRPELNVDLIIRGSLRAGKYQVFGYERDVPSGIAGVTTAPQGRVLLWTRLVPAVYPEWWGALLFARSDVAPSDSSDALQAAIDAACVHRDDPDGGVRRPSIPVLLGSVYACDRTLVVERTASSPTLHLILRGASGLATANVGGSSITRMATTEADRTSGCLLRLGPGVDFDIQDVRFGMNGSLPTWGCIEILGDAAETAPRRGLFRRCTLICGSDSALKIDGPAGPSPRHVLLDACLVSPIGTQNLSRAGVDVRGDASVMLHLDDAFMGAGPWEIPRGPKGRPLASPLPLPPNSTIYLQGASVLVRSTQFHNASGPRPTQKRGGEVGEVDLTQPDGQEIFSEPPRTLHIPRRRTSLRCIASVRAGGSYPART
ncbi:MAG: hypothetical protein IPF99_30735 [Deltaproteobacteria bacterium]|nr:hypothetical protein [Deltaproteobacteria bacterium]